MRLPVTAALMWTVTPLSVHEGCCAHGEERMQVKEMGGGSLDWSSLVLAVRKQAGRFNKRSV